MTRGKTAARAALVATVARKTGVPALIVHCVLNRCYASRVAQLKGDVRLRVELAAKSEGWTPFDGHRSSVETFRQAHIDPFTDQIVMPAQSSSEAARLRLLFPSPKGVGF